MTTAKKRMVSKSAHAPRKVNPGRKSPSTRTAGTHTVESGCNSKNGCSHTETVDNQTGKVVKDSADSEDATDGDTANKGVENTQDQQQEVEKLLSEIEGDGSTQPDETLPAESATDTGTGDIDDTASKETLADA